MFKAAMSWIENNPDYDHSFSNDQERRSFIQQEFDSDVLRAYDRIQCGAFRADLWRYCALYVQGGVYADIDTVSICPLRDLIGRDDKFITAVGTLPGAIFNAFICSIPQHPFLERAIGIAVRNINTGGGYHPMAITGPLCLGRAVNLVLDRDQGTGFPPGHYSFGGYSYRILEKVHTREPGARKVVYEGRTLLMCKYDGYMSDLAEARIRHWTD